MPLLAFLAGACSTVGSDTERAQAERAQALRAAPSAATAAVHGAPGTQVRCLLPGQGAALPEGQERLGLVGGLAVARGILWVTDERALYRLVGGVFERAVALAPDVRPGGERPAPFVLAASAGGRLFAASPEAGTVLEVDPTRGTSEVLASGLAWPSALVASSDGSVAVLESAAGSITQISSDRKLRTLFSGLSSPLALASRLARFLVVEPAGGRVLGLRSGAPPSLIAGNLEGPVGLAVDRAGELLVAESATGALMRLLADGSRVELASGFALRAAARGHPIVAPIALNEQGNIAIAAPGDGSIWRIAEP